MAAFRKLLVRPELGAITAAIGVFLYNGAGKSALIKILSGVHKPTQGIYEFDGKAVELSSPREALDMGIATVFQDLAMLPLISITRNFFLGREPRKRVGLVEVFDTGKASTITNEELNKIGIKLRDPNQAVGTLSGGERQAVAIARAVLLRCTRADSR